MEPPHQATRVRIYISEGDRWNGQTLHTAVLERLRKGGAAGATIFRGLAGIGVHRKIHTVTVEVSAMNLPLIVEWVDMPEQVDRLLPAVSEMVGEGMITIETVQVVKYSHRDLRPIPEDMSVGEVMTRDPATVRPDTPLHTLVEILLGRDYRGVPVTDRAGKITGIVTNTDLLEQGGLRLSVELLSTLDYAAWQREIDQLEAGGKTTADVMTEEIVTVHPETKLIAAARLMIDRGLKRLPVVDQEGVVVGIVSRIDILRTAGESHPAAEPAPRHPSQLGAVAVPAIVGAAMSRTAPTVDADAALSEALDAVNSTPLNRAVVVDAERHPVGIITDAELMRRIDPAQNVSLVRVLLRKLPFMHLSSEERERLRSQMGQRAADLMSAPAATVNESTPVIEAIRRMTVCRYKTLPVVDAEGRLVGLVDRADLLHAVLSE